MMPPSVNWLSGHADMALRDRPCWCIQQLRALHMIFLGSPADCLASLRLAIGRRRNHFLECVEQVLRHGYVFSKQTQVDCVELILEVFVVLNASVEDIGEDHHDIPHVGLADEVTTLDVLTDTDKGGNRIIGMGC